MSTIDFPKLRRELDDAITYADLEFARQLAQEGLNSAQKQELLSEIMYFKAQLEIIDENYEEAINCLNLCLKYNPCDGAAYNDRALCIIDSGGDEEQALADFDKGIEVEPDYASVYHNKGWYLNKLGRTKEAISYFKKTIELETDRAVTYENLADAYVKLGLMQEAVKAFKKALQCLKPSHTEIKEQIEAKIKVLTKIGTDTI
jgi:tetratricopeptide (TPR) repeat protein